MSETTKKFHDIIACMTLEEKASLCSGRDFWSTKGIERLGLKPLTLTDGPHGLRKQSSEGDHADLGASVKATCFPSGAGLGASWDRALAREVGAAIGEEARAEGVSVLLGPAVNIKRSPLCGRNFEYLSEDPFLAGQLAASFIQGVQSKGVGTSVKHFAANNQERLRLTIDARVDERSLREIYLPAFETAVKEAGPWTLMCAYNRLNGEYCSQNRSLLTGILREEWGFDGLLMTDWGACDERAAGLAAGQDLEMPSSLGIGDAAIVAAVREGSLNEELLDRAVERLLLLHERVAPALLARAGAAYDAAAHHGLARRAAAGSAVLLKNEGAILPLKSEGRIAFIGAFAKQPRYQGGGSSHISPSRMDCGLEAAAALLAGKAALSYAPGYELKGISPNAGLIDEACTIAAAADVAVVFAGLPDSMESEGFDRPHMRMPESHTALIEAVARVQMRTIVVLHNGSPVEMPWLGRARAVLEAYLGGQAGGSAVVELLFGAANPSGKLAESFPQRLEDNPSYLNFPGGAKTVEYREGVFVGYRHYDSAKVQPLFPFGHGLSYSSFEYSDLSLGRGELFDDESLEVSIKVRNTSGRAGAEIVQVYVRDPVASVPRPEKELKGFQKLFLEPGEEGTATFTLDSRAFSFWDEASGAWRAEGGEFEILVGSSSRDLRARARFLLRRRSPSGGPWDRNTPLGELFDHPVVGAYARRLKTGFLAAFGGTQAEGSEMFEAMSAEMPLRSLVAMNTGMKAKDLATLLDVLGGRIDAATVDFLRG